MSYAIIRNQNYKKTQLAYVYRHNERKNTNYSNRDIHKENFIQNYSIKTCNTTYANRIKQLIEKYDLKGRIIKTTNVLCEFVITSDKEFFNSIGKEETKRYFETAYNFVADYNNLGEEFIISAKVHLDETTPHMHLVFVPVMHKQDKESGKDIYKIACSEYWKGKDSYHRLQDTYYKYMTERGFELERGNTIDNEHIPIEKLKQVTNYEMQEMFKDTKHLEQEVVTNDIEILRENYRKVIKKFNTLAKRYTRVKNIIEETMYKTEQAQEENIELMRETERLEKENSYLKDFIDKTYEYVSLLFDFPINRLKRLVKDFIDKMKGEN